MYQEYFNSIIFAEFIKADKDAFALFTDKASQLDDKVYTLMSRDWFTDAITAKMPDDEMAAFAREVLAAVYLWVVAPMADHRDHPRFMSAVALLASLLTGITGRRPSEFMTLAAELVAINARQSAGTSSLSDEVRKITCTKVLTALRRTFREIVKNVCADGGSRFKKGVYTQ